MKRQLHMITLRTVRHNDKSSILTAYSRESGRVAFAVSAGTGREASRRRALLMPLGLVECVADIKPGREIHVMHDLRAVMPLHGLRSNPVKSAIGVFVAEVLGLVLRDGPPDELLYEYVYRNVVVLDALPGVGIANFHLCFLYGLGRFLGIEPDVDGYRDGMIFDMADGCFRMTQPLHRHFLDGAASRAVVALSRMTLENMHVFKMSRQQRNELLNGVLEYYSLHYTALNGLRSLDILRELF